MKSKAPSQKYNLAKERLSVIGEVLLAERIGSPMDRVECATLSCTKKASFSLRLNSLYQLSWVSLPKGLSWSIESFDINDPTVPLDEYDVPHEQMKKALEAGPSQVMARLVSAIEEVDFLEIETWKSKNQVVEFHMDEFKSTYTRGILLDHWVWDRDQVKLVARDQEVVLLSRGICMGTFSLGEWLSVWKDGERPIFRALKEAKKLDLPLEFAYALGTAISEYYPNVLSAIEKREIQGALDRQSKKVIWDPGLVNVARI